MLNEWGKTRILVCGQGGKGDTGKQNSFYLFLIPFLFSLSLYTSSSLPFLWIEKKKKLLLLTSQAIGHNLESMVKTDVRDLTRRRTEGRPVTWGVPRTSYRFGTHTCNIEFN
jgi:hypothetical protein